MVRKIAFICPDIGIDFGRTRVILNLLTILAESYKNYKVYLITNSGSNLEPFNKLNLECFLIPISIRHRNLFKFCSSLFKLFMFIKKNNVDIIHSHHRYTDLLVYFLGWLIKIKKISTAHSFVYGSKFLSFKSDIVVCVSKALESYLKAEFHISRSKLEIIPNGVLSVNENIPKKKSNFCDKTLNFLCIGRFDYEKGQDVLLEAVYELICANHFINLSLVGGYSSIPIKYPPEYNVKSKKFRDKLEWQIEKTQSLRIFESKETPWEKISNADVIIIPSRIESFGLVAIEAGLVHRCVIAAETGGLPEIIKNKENGLLFQSENIEDLKEKIIFALNNRELITIMGENLYRDVINNFTAELMTKKYVALYEKLLNQT
jgi:glycosyltransferase involved in cell wall biosynthesis